MPREPLLPGIPEGNWQKLLDVIAAWPGLMKHSEPSQAERCVTFDDGVTVTGPES